MTDDKQIREKLAKIKALFAGATTLGERQVSIPPGPVPGNRPGLRICGPFRRFSGANLHSLAFRPAAFSS
jgi:hypothetical protein